MKIHASLYQNLVNVILITVAFFLPLVIPLAAYFGPGYASYKK